MNVINPAMYEIINVLRHILNKVQIVYFVDFDLVKNVAKVSNLIFVIGIDVSEKNNQ